MGRRRLPNMMLVGVGETVRLGEAMAAKKKQRSAWHTKKAKTRRGLAKRERSQVDVHKSVSMPGGYRRADAGVCWLDD